MKRATSAADGATPLYERLCESLRESIASGRLAPGTKLPSTRALARELRVSRNTVVNAYEQLALEGFVVTRIGSGTHVLGAKPTRVDLQKFVRQSGYPADAVAFADEEGNALYIHR
ncbi:MAG TPA: winged helix-turn-helix domain-containing protein [Thermoanaerobaculia bacterium]|jgi:GntR family transcriptional regulator/MocR family aminotransferase